MSVSTPANAAVSNPVQAALEAFKAGRDPGEAVYGNSPSVSDTPAEGENSTPADSFSSLQEGETADQEGEAEPSTLSPDAGNDEAPKAVKVKEIIVTDDEGRKKLKVDFADEEKLTQYVQTAYAAQKGMRKFQAERDQANSRLQDIEPKYKDLEESWSSVETAYKQAGLKGLADLLGGAGTYDKLIEREFSRRNATPAERERFDLEERMNRSEADRKRLEKQVQDNLSAAEKERDEAYNRSVASRVEPAFEKYRFAGKLGDPVAEHQVDQAIWSQTMEQLDEWGDAYRKANGLAATARIDVPREIVERSFRTVSANFQKIISKQAEVKTAAVLKQKKEAAAETAAVQATKGMARSNETEAFKTNIRSGNIVGALRQFASGKIKL